MEANKVEMSISLQSHTGCVPSPKVPVTFLLSLSPGSITAPSLIPSDRVKLVASCCSQSLKLSLYPTHTFYINS